MEIDILGKNDTRSGFGAGLSYLGETTYYKIICGKDIEPLNVSTQNSFGQMNYKVGEKVKLNIDKDNIVGFSG